MTRRTIRLDSKAARSKLKPRQEPYWIRIGAKGHHLGYRRLPGGFGTWLAKWRDPEAGKRLQEPLGTADDVLAADGVNVLEWTQADTKAREFFARASKAPTQGARVTVETAIREYFEARELNGKAKSFYGDWQYAQAHIIPKFGSVEVRKLTKANLQQWRDDLARTGARVRTSRGAPQQYRVRDADTEDAKRARRATTNRVWAIFRAALNHAADTHGLSREEWSSVKTFRGASKARVRFFSADESLRLVNASDPGFRDMIRAGLLTGARYGELTRLRRDDFSVTSRTLFVRESKSGRPRYIALTGEGVSFFLDHCQGLASNDLIFKNPNGQQWGVGQQKFYFDSAAEAANVKLDRGDGFHCLRHTYASVLVMGGVPLKAVAEQLGHATTMMVEKHYGHLASGFVANAVERAMGNLGITAPSNVAGIRDKAA
jgi:integrase